jgi:hypothetical protein
MQVKYKAVIFHLQQMVIRRRIIKLHTNTADICINSNNKIQQLCQFKSHIRGVYEVNGLLNAQNGKSLKKSLKC